MISFKSVADFLSTGEGICDAVSIFVLCSSYAFGLYRSKIEIETETNKIEELISKIPASKSTVETKTGPYKLLIDSAEEEEAMAPESASTERPTVGAYVFIRHTPQFGIIIKDYGDHEPYIIEDPETHTRLKNIEGGDYFTVAALLLATREEVRAFLGKDVFVIKIVNVSLQVAMLVLAISVLMTRRMLVILCLAIWFSAYFAFLKLHDKLPAVLGSFVDMLPRKCSPVGRFAFPLIGAMGLVYFCTPLMHATIPAAMIILWSFVAAMTVNGASTAAWQQYFGSTFMLVLLLLIIVVYIWQLDAVQLSVKLCFVWVIFGISAGGNWTDTPLTAPRGEKQRVLACSVLFCSVALLTNMAVTYWLCADIALASLAYSLVLVAWLRTAVCPDQHLPCVIAWSRLQGNCWKNGDIVEFHVDTEPQLMDRHFLSRRSDAALSEAGLADVACISELLVIAKDGQPKEFSQIWREVEKTKKMKFATKDEFISWVRSEDELYEAARVAVKVTDATGEETSVSSLYSIDLDTVEFPTNMTLDYSIEAVNEDVIGFPTTVRAKLRWLDDEEEDAEEEERQFDQNGETKKKQADFVGLIVRLTFHALIASACFACGVFINYLGLGSLGMFFVGTVRGTSFSRALTSILDLKAKIPLWLNMLVCFSKPIVLTRIFGTPKSDEASVPSRIKLYVIAPFFVMLTILAWLKDIEDIGEILVAKLLAHGERAALVLVAIAVSSNVQTALAFGTMLLNYQSANAGEVRKALFSMGRLQGWLWVTMMGLTTMIFTPVMIVMSVAVFPGLLMYWWLTVPFFGASWLYWRLLKREAYNQNSFVASLLGTNRVAAQGMLGALGSTPPRCRKNHLMLPVKGRGGWMCDGTDESRVGKEGVERRVATKIKCEIPGYQAEPGCIQFRCWACDSDLCRTCYAEQKAWDANETLEAWLPKVEELHGSHAIDTTQGYDEADEVLQQTKIEEAKQWAMTLIPLVPVLGASLPMFVPVVMRFYLSEGYLNAVLSTWSDRSIHEFGSSMTSRSVKSLHHGKKLLHAMGTYHFDAALKLLVHWLHTLNYII